jgi:hypothetical protein
MSDLAPFVAAALRDKVVQDLMEENKALRQKLQFARRVEITGPGGTPVHARAQFDDNGEYHGNPNLWSVKFTKGKQLLACPLAALAGIEIWVGGILKAKFAQNSDFETFFDRDVDDHAMGKVASFCFLGASSLWLSVLIDGWPQERYTETMTDRTRGPDDEFPHLIETVAMEAPLGKMATFLEVAFMCSGVSGVIKSLNLPAPEGDDTSEDVDDEREQQEFFTLILDRLKSHAGLAPGDPLPSETAQVTMHHASSIRNALNRLGIEGQSAMFDQVIDLLIDSRQMSETDEGFEGIVNNMVAITDGTYQASDDEDMEGGPMSE